PERGPMSADARARRVVWQARFGAAFIRALGLTWRMRISHDDDLRRCRANGTPVILILWHGQMLPLLYAHRNEGVAVLISEHADGELIAQIVRRLGCTTVRGSTSRGAARALIGLTRAAERGSDLAITPDGPRGPEKSVAPGALIVAHRTGVPMIAMAASPSSCWRLRSWDRFMVPRPFARIRVAYSDAVYVEASDSHEAATQVSRVEAAFALAEQRADA
ncbi:MAG: lysophospholipid acyltransferase family protein, partial [Gemmatimonadaceae bacterium]